MLVKAMEVSGIEGNFRSTCENVMQVLRAHKDSVMAMMEVYTEHEFFCFCNCELGYIRTSLMWSILESVYSSFTPACRLVNDNASLPMF